MGSTRERRQYQKGRMEGRKEAKEGMKKVKKKERKDKLTVLSIVVK